MPSTAVSPISPRTSRSPHACVVQPGVSAFGVEVHQHLASLEIGELHLVAGLVEESEGGSLLAGIEHGPSTLPGPVHARRVRMWHAAVRRRPEHPLEVLPCNYAEARRRSSVGTFFLVFFAVGVATLSFGFKFSGIEHLRRRGRHRPGLRTGPAGAWPTPSGPISGCHINPAVTMGFLVSGRMALVEAVGYWIAQFVGGIAGALVLWGVFSGSPIYSRHRQRSGRRRLRAPVHDQDQRRRRLFRPR